jgi:hypothetical protein
MRRRRWRAADAQAGADVLQVIGGVGVEVEVGLHARDAVPEVDVGLVPDFEVPGGDLIDAVAIDEVLGEVAS